MGKAPIRYLQLVRVADSAPVQPEHQGRLGFVQAVRTGTNGETVYAVFVCDEGVGWSCPNGRSYLLTGEYLRTTGERYAGDLFVDEPEIAEWERDHPPALALGERVRVRTERKEIAAIDGKEGTVGGLSPSPALGRWSYPVMIDGDLGWMVEEGELEPLGVFGS